jgi:hypothetical protein
VRMFSRLRVAVFGRCGACGLVLGSLILGAVLAGNARAEGLWGFSLFRKSKNCGNCPVDEYTGNPELGGSWMWVRSPEEEKRHVIGLYNRYCIRCHGVDGRGIWDIPDVPNFTNVRWQETRSDSRIAHSIIEGRGACMPPFRGAINLEEAWALARYIRTLVPGTEVSKPDLGQPEKTAKPVPDKPAK